MEMSINEIMLYGLSTGMVICLAAMIFNDRRKLAKILRPNRPMAIPNRKK